MRKRLGILAALLAITAVPAATLASTGPYDRHLYLNSVAAAAGWPDGTQQNSNF